MYSLFILLNREEKKNLQEEKKNFQGLEPPSNGTDSKKGDTGDATQGPSEVSRGSTGASCPMHAR